MWENNELQLNPFSLCHSPCVCVLSRLSRTSPYAALWTVAHQSPLSKEFSRQEYWSGLPCHSPGHLPEPGIEPGSLALQADALPSEPPGKAPDPPPRSPPIHEGRGQILCPNCWWFVVLSLQEKVEMQRQRFRWEFEKYRGFLALEEQLQLRRLEEEERATLQKLRESKNRLVQQSRALKELAEELEERCQRPALGLLEVRLGAWEKKDGHTWDQGDRWQLSEITP